jgi:hypothetical protein
VTFHAEGHPKARDDEIPMKIAGTLQSIMKKVEEKGGLATGYVHLKRDFTKSKETECRD